MKKLWTHISFILIILLSATLSFGGKKKKNKQTIPAPSLNLASVIGNNISKPPVTAKVLSYAPEDMIPVAVYQLRKELDSLSEAIALQELTHRIKVHNNNKFSDMLQWKQRCNELYRARALLYASKSDYFQALQDIAVIISGNFFHNHSDQEFLYCLFIEYYEHLRMQSTLRDFYDQGLQKLKEFKYVALLCKTILAEMASADWLEKELVNLNAKTNQFVSGVDFQEILQGEDSFDEVLAKNVIKSGRKAQIRGVIEPLAVFDVFAVDALLGHLGEVVDWSVLKRESVKIITDLLLTKMRFEKNINFADEMLERKNIFHSWPKIVIETSVIRSIVEVMYLYSAGTSLQQSDVNKILLIVKDNKSLHESVWGDVLKKYYDCACQFSGAYYTYSMYKDSYKQKPREELKVIIEKLEAIIAHDLPPFFVQQIKELLDSCKFTYCTTFLNGKGFFEKGISEAQIKEVCHIFQKIVENDSAHAFDAAMNLGICLLSYMSLEKSKPFINQALFLYDRRSKTCDEKAQEKHRLARFLTLVVSSGVYSLLNSYDKSLFDYLNDLHHRLVDVADAAYAPYVVYLHLALSLFKEDAQVCDAFIELVNLYRRITTKEVYYDQVRYCYKQGLQKIVTKINDAHFYTLFFEKALKALTKDNALILLEILVKDKKLDHLTVSELSLLIHAYARVGFADDVHIVSMQAALLDKLKQVPIETVACEQLFAAFNCFTLKNPEVAIKRLQCRAHIIFKQKPKNVQEYVDCLFMVEKCLHDSAFLLSDSMSEQEAVIAIATQVLNCALEQGLFTSVLSSCMYYEKIADLMADYVKCFLLVHQNQVLDFQDFAKIADFLTYNYCRLRQEKAHALFELLIKSVTFDPFKMEDYFDRVDILAAIDVDEEYSCLTHCYLKYAKFLVVSDEEFAYNADVKSFYVRVQALATKLRMCDEYTVLVQKLDTITADIENYMCVGMYTAVEQRLARLLDISSYNSRKKAFDKFFKVVKRFSGTMPDAYAFVNAYASLVPALNEPLYKLQDVQALIEVCRLFEQYEGDVIGAFTYEFQQPVLDYIVKTVSDLLASKKYSIESIYVQFSSQIALTHVQQALAMVVALPQFSGEMAQYCVDQLWKTKNYELCIPYLFVELIKKLRTCNDTQRELKVYMLMARHCVASLSKGVIDSDEVIVKSLYEACKKFTGRDQWDAYYLLKSRASDSVMSSIRKELLSAIRFVFENPQAIIEGLYTGEFSLGDISISTLDKLVLLIENNKVFYGDRLYCLAYYFYISKLLTSQKSFDPQFLVQAHGYLMSLREFLTNSDEILAVDRLLERIVSQLP